MLLNTFNLGLVAAVQLWQLSPFRH